MEEKRVEKWVVNKAPIVLMVLQDANIVSAAPDYGRCEKEFGV